MRVNKELLIDLHTVWPLTQSDYTRSCINTIVHLRMSTELLKTCRGFKQTYYRRNCASSWAVLILRCWWDVCFNDGSINCFNVAVLVGCML
jgi:hypothetical protein